MEEFTNNLPAGYVLDQYSIEAVLGTGSFGVTYKAYDNQLHQTVAIKEYLPAEMARRASDSATVQPRQDSVGQFRWGLDRFLEEARTLARFRHANIVRVTRFLEANGTAYLVMDYVEGESLQEYLKRTGKPVSEEQLKAWFIPVLQGLVTVHASGFLHRDIKPGNIYLRDNGEPVLIDFGAARQAMGEHSKSVTGIFTAGYAPIEQYSTEGKKQGPWTDLYAIGATLYRCVTGLTPTDAPTRQSAVMEGDADPLVPASVKGAGKYSPAFLQLIDELLVLPIRGRPQSAAPVLAALAAGRSLSGGTSDRSAATVVADNLGTAEAETVLIAKRPEEPAPKIAIPPRPAPAAELHAPPKKRMNREVLGAMTGFLILGAFIIFITSWFTANPSKVERQSAAEAANARLVTEAAAKAEVEAKTRSEAAARVEEEALARSAAEAEAKIEAEAQARFDAKMKAIEEFEAAEQERIATADALAKTQAEAQAKAEAEAQAKAEAEKEIQARERFGQLTLNIDPPAAKVILPDIKPAYAPGMSLEVGQYRVIIKAPGYLTFEGTFEMVSAGCCSSEIKLERDQQLELRAKAEAEAERIAQVEEEARSAAETQTSTHVDRVIEEKSAECETLYKKFLNAIEDDPINCNHCGNVWFRGPGALLDNCEHCAESDRAADMWINCANQFNALKR